MGAVLFRLTSHVAARVHACNGGSKLVLHDARSGRDLLVDARWRQRLVQRLGLDGHDDIDDGAAVLPGFDAFWADLLHLQMVAAKTKPQSVAHDGPDSPALVAEPRYRTPPGLSFRCSRRGLCCRTAQSVVFPAEAASRVRSLLAVDTPFMPLQGSGRSLLVAPRRDGGCAFLEPIDAGGDGCSIHRRSGVESKPIGCQTFPLTVVDDGEALVSSLLWECECVAESQVTAPPSVGVSTEPPADFNAAAITEAITVLPATISVTIRHRVDRAVVVAWGREVAQFVATKKEGGCAALFLWSQAEAWDQAEGAAPSVEGADIEGGGGGPCDAERLASHFKLALAGAESLESHSRFRPRTGLILRLAKVAAALEPVAIARRIVNGLGCQAPAARVGEWHAVYQAAFGHQWLTDAEPIVADALRARAIRIWLSRELEPHWPGDQLRALPPLEALARSLRLMG